MEDNLTESELEEFWGRLLSRDVRQVRETFASAAPDEQAAVLQHLKRMAVEPGWHPEQRISAQAALAALEPG